MKPYKQSLKAPASKLGSAVSSGLHRKLFCWQRLVTRKARRQQLSDKLGSCWKIKLEGKTKWYLLPKGPSKWTLSTEQSSANETWSRMLISVSHCGQMAQGTNRKHDMRFCTNLIYRGVCTWLSEMHDTELRNTLNGKVCQARNGKGTNFWQNNRGKFSVKLLTKGRRTLSQLPDTTGITKE